MKIYDKADWQLDGGMEKEVVLRHFEFIFQWLKDHDMLSVDGQELYDLGVDEEITLNEQLVTEEGAAFLDRSYDELIEKTKYDVSAEKEWIEKLYSQYQNQ